MGKDITVSLGISAEELLDELTRGGYIHSLALTDVLRDDDLTIGRIHEKTGMDKSSLSRSLQKAVDDGVLEVFFAYDPAVRRRVKVFRKRKAEPEADSVKD